MSYFSCLSLSILSEFLSILQAATDLLVRQKNFSVGLPNNEIDITQSVSMSRDSHVTGAPPPQTPPIVGAGG